MGNAEQAHKEFSLKVSVCCEAVRSAILATAWLLVSYEILGSRSSFSRIPGKK